METEKMVVTVDSILRILYVPVMLRVLPDSCIFSHKQSKLA